MAYSVFIVGYTGQRDLSCNPLTTQRDIHNARLPCIIQCRSVLFVLFWAIQKSIQFAPSNAVSQEFSTLFLHYTPVNYSTKVGLIVRAA